MKRLCRMLCLACAVLLLLPACRTRPTDAPTAELFAQTDGPVVVQLKNIFIYDELVSRIWNAPHVISVICPTRIHWLDASDEGSLCMIGQYPSDLDPDAVAEGRWYTDTAECCVNRAEYQRLLNDADAHFLGLGSTVTYSEPKMPPTPGDFIDFRAPISKTLTVVGVVDDEGDFANADIYGKHHIYTPMDVIAAMFANYEANNTAYASHEDVKASIITKTISQFPDMMVCRPDPDRDGEMLLRCSEDRIYTEEEWWAMFRDLPCNAGYTVEVTLDSGKNYAAFSDYWRALLYTEKSAREVEEERLKMIPQLYETYEKKTHPEGATLTPELIERNEIWLKDALTYLEQNPTVSRLIELGELDDWCMCGKAPYIVIPLRVEK